MFLSGTKSLLPAPVGIRIPHSQARASSPSCRRRVMPSLSHASWDTFGEQPCYPFFRFRFGAHRFSLLVIATFSVQRSRETRARSETPGVPAAEGLVLIC